MLAETIRALLILVGAGLLVVAAAMVAAPLGVAAAGAGLIVIGILSEATPENRP